MLDSLFRYCVPPEHGKRLERLAKGMCEVVLRGNKKKYLFNVLDMNVRFSSFRLFPWKCPKL